MSLIHIVTPGLMARVGVLSERAPRTRWETGDKVGGRAGHMKGILPPSGTRNSPVQLRFWTFRTDRCSLNFQGPPYRIPATPVPQQPFKELLPGPGLISMPQTD